MFKAGWSYIRALCCAVVCSITTGGCLLLMAQIGPARAPVTEMPLERVADSYAIYRQVLPSNSIEWSDVKRTEWLLQDVTTATPLAEPCEGKHAMGPTEAVTPPADRKAEWDEVLADFNEHCHDRYKLVSGNLALSLPVHLLDDEAQKRYWSGVSGFMPPKNNIMLAPPTPDDFKGAAGLHSFSAVYFNRKHTLAATYFGMGCGSLCGNWTWVVLEKTPEGWKRLLWVHMSMFS
jgi:hypothetical protein